MPKIDFSSVRERFALHDTASAYIPELRKRGNEYFGLCPFHDDKSPSFTIYPTNDGYERYHCFACQASGDIVDFVSDIRQCTAQDAVQWLQLGHVPAVSTRAKEYKAEAKKPDVWTPLVPVPADAPAYDPAVTHNPKRGEDVAWRPESVTPYVDADGRLHYYVVRMNLGVDAEGKRRKICATVSYAESIDGQRKWVAYRPNPPHILLGLDLLAKYPDRSVLVVSGEKCWKAGEPLNQKNGFVPVSWMGGDGAVEYTDWTPLAGRRVVFFPDADEPGHLSMSKIPLFIGGDLAQVRHIETIGLPKGCDLADIIDNGHRGKDLIEWFRKRVKDGPVPVPAHIERQQAGNKATDKGTPALKDSKGSALHTAPPGAASFDARSNVVPLRKPQESSYGDSCMEYSDQYCAARYRAKFEGRVLYVPEWRSTMIWDEGEAMWRNELTNPLLSHVGEFLNELSREVSLRLDLGKAAEQHAKRMSNYSAASSLVQIVRNDQFFRAGSGTFDTDPYEIGVPGGVVNLRTGQLRPRRPEDRISKCTSVSPEKGKPVRWLNFLSQIMGGDKDMIHYLQVMCGYFLTGDTTESQWYFFYGSGRNGKSTLLNLVGELMGDYYKAGQTETFMQSFGDRHPADVAALQGARLVTAMEVPDNKTWNVVRIKQMTGGDPVTARMMRGNDFSYLPQYKLVFTGNDLPRLRGVDEALRRRLHLIPFDVTISVKDEDKTLPGHLRTTEAGQILQWMIDGAGMWFKERIRAPQKVTEATDDYLDDSDIIKQFCEQELRPCTGYDEPTTEVFKRFREFTEGANEWQGRQRWLTGQLKKRGYDIRRTTVGGKTSYVVTNVRLASANGL